MPERKTYSIPEAAQKLGLSDHGINELLRNRQLFCTIRLTGSFVEIIQDGNVDYINERGNTHCIIPTIKPVTIGNGGGTYNDFVILNYDMVKIRHKDDSVYLVGDAELRRVKDVDLKSIYAPVDIIADGKLFITAEEIERYEAANRPMACTKQYPSTAGTETAEQLRDRLKTQGLDVKSIAKELKRLFPDILPSRIGRLLPAHPGSNISSDAHRKRGERLLK